VRLIAPGAPLSVAPGVTATTSVFVVAPGAAFHEERLDVRFRVSDGGAWHREFPWPLRGPESAEPEKERAP
jgi:hypothetical protein